MRTTPMPTNAKTKRTLLAAGLALATLSAAPAARAQRELLTPTGGRGQLALDGLVGVRTNLNGIAIGGPIGFSYSTYNVDSSPSGQTQTGQTRVGFWIAPQLDYFVVDRLSIGGRIEFQVTTRTDSTTTVVAGTKTTTDTGYPALVDFTLLPRVGYMIPIGSRFAIWPRAAIGFAMRQNHVTPSSNGTFNALALGLDVGFVIRMNETFYLKIQPEMTWLPVGGYSARPANVTVSGSGSSFELGLLTAFGAFLPLF
jgi:opacity protein-like surface antigen